MNKTAPLIYLYLYLGDNYDGPGWYIRVISESSSETERPVHISNDVALSLAQAFETALSSTHNALHPPTMTCAIVSDGNQRLYDTLQEQLAEAEAKAARIAILRQRLASLSDQTQPERNENGEH